MKYSFLNIGPQHFRIIIIPILFLFGLSSLAWLYPEHRAITMNAIYDLDAENRIVLDEVWMMARTGYESRLSESPADSMLGVQPQYIDYAAWPAISGDHSCSSENLLYNVLETAWILNVAHVSARLKIGLDEAGLERHRRMNVVRDSDIALQTADKAYATRAGSNHVHFLLARPDVRTDASHYFKKCLSKGTELNAIGAYFWFHISALLKAKEYLREDLTLDQRISLARAILADEAYAIHFIEDAFASGHVAGTWGDVSMRKGTHDYYNEMGLDVVTWMGESLVLLGDAWMRDEDATRAARVVRMSLEQVLQVLDGKGLDLNWTDTDPISFTPDSLNVCEQNFMPGRVVNPSLAHFTEKILMETPMPGLAEGLGELPRFRTELGPFVGVMASFHAGVHKGGFLANQNDIGWAGGIEMTARLGFGLEGVLNEAGDGLIFFDLGYRQDGSSTSKIIDEDPELEFGSITAAIPGRRAIVTRLRMPFWLIPGDLLLASPILAFTSPSTLAKMAIKSGNGGLIPWQSGMATSFGRFQFILGREVGAYFYGYSDEADRILAIAEKDGFEELVLLDLKTIHLQLPVVEYRPFRTFSTDQTSSLVVQLYTAVEFPTKITVVTPENVPTPEVRNIWYLGFRIAFDWRHYL